MKVYFSNWSSHRTEGHHGPGRKLTIMAEPRRWERGEGWVDGLIPSSLDLREMKAGEMTLEEYRARFLRMVKHYQSVGYYLPGSLPVFRTGRGGWLGSLEDGDTLCCACSREAASKGECHRVWAAEVLKAAGWDVVLDGVLL